MFEGYDEEYRNSSGGRIYDAVEKNDIKLIKYLLDDRDINEWTLDRKEKLIMYAISFGYFDILRHLLIHFGFKYIDERILKAAIFDKRLDILKYLHQNFEYSINESILNYAEKLEYDKELIAHLMAQYEPAPRDEPDMSDY